MSSAFSLEVNRRKPRVPAPDRACPPPSSQNGLRSIIGTAMASQTSASELKLRGCRETKLGESPARTSEEPTLLPHFSLGGSAVRSILHNTFPSTLPADSAL